ncbi:MAG: hypothetical protein IPL40_02000 [Proteobacteria bacterium]|nr:hypothetical protein [Pseudomonadota bacterium]
MALPGLFERLLSLGSLALPIDAEPEVAAACLSIARRLKRSGRHAIGLWPCDGTVAVPPLALRLGAALVHLTRANVAVIDANVRYPAFAAEGAGGPAAPSEPDDAGEAQRAIFVERWIGPSLALLIPPHAGEPGAGVRQLQLLLNAQWRSFTYLLVDLSGFDRFGDHLNAAALLDGVALVARAGRSSEAELIRMRDELPPHLNLGVVLTG